MLNTISKMMNRNFSVIRSRRTLALTLFAAALAPALDADTYYRVIYYNENTGASAVTALDSNNNPYTLPPPATVAGFTQIVEVGAGTHLFYNEHSGAAAYTQLDVNGNLQTLQTFNFSPNWLITSHKGHLLFYDKSLGNAVFGDIVGTSFYQYSRFSISPGWDHIVSTDRGLLFYNSGDGSGATGDVAFDYQPCAGGGFCFPTVANIRLVGKIPYGPGSFAVGWTQVVNTNSGVLFYRKDDGLVAVVDIDNAGNVSTRPNSIKYVDANYTSVVVSGTAIQFYNKDNGNAALGDIVPISQFIVNNLWGTLEMTKTFYDFAPGWTVVANATIILVN